MKLMDLQTFNELPLIVEGESKIVRAHKNPELCWIKYKPTIYSFTANRTAIIPGSDRLRLEATKIFVEQLKLNGIDHVYLEFNEEFILAKKIHEPPPIEVVVKACHSGTSKYRYYGMGTVYKTRLNHPFYKGEGFIPEESYPEPIVRFDWRNPMYHPETGKPLADEVLGESQADWFIDTKVAKTTALRTYKALSDFLITKDIVLYDLCLFISSDGNTVFGEISQDCGRFRHFNLGSLDKDIWRAGGSSNDVLEKWVLLLKSIQ